MATTVQEVLAKGSIADDTVLRVREDVEDRSEVERHAYGPQLGREGAGKTAREVLVLRPAQREHRRPLGERTLESRDPPPFLIDAHPGRRIAHELAGLGGDLGHLLGSLHVAREEDHAAQRELSGDGAQLDREGRAVESCDEQLTDAMTDGAW